MFGERLKQLRLIRGLSREQVANGLEIAVPTIGAYERGDREPSLQMIGEIARFFNVSLDYLFGLSEETDTLAQYKEKARHEVEHFLRQEKVYFRGNEISELEKQRLLDFLTGMHWNK